MDIAGVETDIDDILIWSKNTEDRNRSLIASLERAKKTGLTMKLNKCKFNADELICDGLKISARGIEPEETKIKQQWKCQNHLIMKEYKDFLD